MTRRLRGNDWLFDPERGDGGIIINQHNGDMPEYRPGASYQMEFLFWDAVQSIVHETGGQAGGVHGFQAGGPNGTTAGPVGGDSQPDHRGRYRALRRYTDYAGRYSMERSIDGTPLITERLPPDADVDSIICQVIPGPDLKDTPGLWVVVDDVDDMSTNLADLARIGIDITVLGRRSDWSDREELKAEIGSEL